MENLLTNLLAFHCLFLRKSSTPIEISLNVRQILQQVQVSTSAYQESMRAEKYEQPLTKSFEACLSALIHSTDQ